MKRIKNRLSVPTTTVQWRHEGKHVIEWRTAVEMFDQWVGKVQMYCNANSLPVPTEEQLDALACSQMPRHACTEDAGYHAPIMQRSVRVGCGSCGGKRK